MTGQSASPPMTLASAPSIPAMAMMTAGPHDVIQMGQQAVEPCHPHIIQAHHFVAVDFGGQRRFLCHGDIRLVPPVATTIFPMPSGAGMGPTMPTFASLPVDPRRVLLGHLGGGIRQRAW